MRLDALLENLKENGLLQPTSASPYDPPKLKNPVWSQEYERVQLNEEELFKPIDEKYEGEDLYDQIENILSDDEGLYNSQQLNNCEILDAAAWYCPFHFYEDDYGIYIKEDAVNEYAQGLWLSLDKKKRIEVWAQPSHIRRLFERQLIQASRLRLFFHELYHHRVECFATRIEMNSSRRFFAQYNELVYQKYSNPLHDFLIEEALASAYPLGQIKKRKSALFPTLPGCPNVGDILLEREFKRIKKSKVLGYRGAARLVQGPFGQKKSALYSKSIGLNSTNFKELEWKLQQTIREGFYPPVDRGANWEFAPDMMRQFFNVSEIAYKLIPRKKYLTTVSHSSTPIEYLSIKPRKALRKARDWGIFRTGSGKGDHAKIGLPDGTQRDFDMGRESLPQLEWGFLIEGMNMQLPDNEKYKNNQKGKRRFMRGP